MDNCKLFYVSSTRVRPIVGCMSSIITMDLLVGLKRYHQEGDGYGRNT